MEAKRTITEITRVFSERLNELVEIEKNNAPKKLSEGRVADQMGINRPALHKYLNDDTEIGINNLVKIAKYFEVSTDYLLGLTEASPQKLSAREICEATDLDKNAIDGLKMLTRKSSDSASESLEEYYAFKSDQFDIELPPFDQCCGVEAVFQNILPSRRTIICEMLSSAEFVDFVEAIRDSITVSITSNLRRQFRDIHDYYQADFEAFEDKKSIGVAKYEFHEAAIKLLTHLVDAYTQDNQSKIDNALQKYANAAQKYDALSPLEKLGV